jgi:ribosome recycling factor
MADSVIIKIPSLTEDRRKDISKIAKGLAEDAKVSVRNVRQESLKDIKKSADNKEISEDIQKQNEDDLQKLIDEANKKIDEYYKKKDEDVMRK